MEKKQTEKNKQPSNFIPAGLGIIFESVLIAISCLAAETKGQTFCGIPGFYLTSGAVDYTAVIFFAHLVVVNCEVFTTTSTKEIQL